MTIMAIMLKRRRIKRLQNIIRRLLNMLPKHGAQWWSVCRVAITIMMMTIFMRNTTIIIKSTINIRNTTKNTSIITMTDAAQHPAMFLTAIHANMASATAISARGVVIRR